MHFSPYQVALIFVSSIFFLLFLKSNKMYRISSMQVPDEEFILPKITKPQKTSSSKKFLKDESEDSSSSQINQNLSPTQRQNDKKQQPNDSTTNNLQKDIKNIKKQQEKQKKRKKKNKTKKQMSSSNKQQKKDKFNCRFYMQGSCKNGTICKFIHPVDFPPIQPTKPKQPKLQPYPKKQSSTQQKQQPQPQTKYSRDQYFERMIDTMKLQCYSCKKREILVTLSCGCQSICEFCVRSRMACSKENHFYDDKVYIK